MIKVLFDENNFLSNAISGFDVDIFPFVLFFTFAEKKLLLCKKEESLFALGHFNFYARVVSVCVCVCVCVCVITEFVIHRALLQA
jgi:hypothetical protein